MTDAPKEPFHSRAGVQWGVIVTVIFQVGLIIWTASAASQRLDRLERDVADAKDIPGRVIRLETQLANIDRTLADLNMKMDRLLQQRRGGSGSP